MKHANKATAWFCPECEAALCDVCVQKIAAVGPRACPYCGGRLKQAERRAVPVASVGTASKPDQPPPVEYARAASRLGRPDRSGHQDGDSSAFLKAVAYPVQGRGRWMLAGGTLLYVVLGLFQWIPFLRGAILFVTASYAMSYLMKIISESANGESEPPDWPDIHSPYDGIIVPFFRGLGCLVISFFPLVVVFVWQIVALIMASPMPFTLTPLQAQLLLVLGAVYYPRRCWG